ncbi:MAG: hypothetical protein ACKO5K_12440 [Armatimonadota bacterium]
MGGGFSAIAGCAAGLLAAALVSSRAVPAGSPNTALRSMDLDVPPIVWPISFDTAEADGICAAIELLPRDNALRTRIDQWPLHPNSRALVNAVGAAKPLRVNTDMAFVIVPADQKRVPVRIVDYADESDPGPFPIPDAIPIEGWPVEFREEGSKATLAQVQRRPAEYESDRHAIVLDPGNRRLHEFFNFGRTSTGWAANQASTFELSSNRLRPEGWTSADAAGLPILPLVVRHDEFARGSVDHALRVTVRRTRKAFVYPATHSASRFEEANLPRMGERFRLRRDFDVSGFSKGARAILEGLKAYGMVVADNGIEWAVSTTPDPRNPDIHEELRRVKGSDFEVVVAPPGWRRPR